MELKQLTPLAAACGFALVGLAVACGIVKSDYKKYGDEGGTGTATAPVEPDTEACKAAQTAFNDNVNPTLKSKCAIAGCHQTTAINSGNLSDDPANNRRLLKGFNASSKGPLADKIAQANGKVHGGGDKTGDLPKSKIDAWLTKENDCK